MILGALNIFLFNNIGGQSNAIAIYSIPLLSVILIICSYVLFFIAVAHQIKMRLKSVNEILRAQILSKNGTSSSIKVLSIVHIQLNSAINFVNKVFALPAALFLGSNLYGATFSLYETYDILRNNSNDFNIHLGYNLAIYFLNIHHFVYNFGAVAVSMAVGRQQEETREILMEILQGNRVGDDKLKRRLRLFVLQTKHARMDFSCGMFKFDWILLYTVSRMFWVIHKKINCVKKFPLIHKKIYRSSR